MNGSFEATLRIEALSQKMKDHFSTFDAWVAQITEAGRISKARIINRPLESVYASFTSIAPMYHPFSD